LTIWAFATRLNEASGCYLQLKIVKECLVSQWFVNGIIISGKALDAFFQKSKIMVRRKR